MNRLVVNGLLEEMRQGKRVIVVSETMVAARAALRSFAERLDSRSGERAWFTNGNERIEGASGTIWLTSRRSSLRGLSADVAFVDDAALDLKTFGELQVCVMASHTPEIIRA